jgi:hypothetical protein
LRIRRPRQFDTDPDPDPDVQVHVLGVCSSRDFDSAPDLAVRSSCTWFHLTLCVLVQRCIFVPS